MGIQWWKVCRGTKNLTYYLNSYLPIPHNKSLKEYMIPAKVASRMISCLCRDELLIESLRKMSVLGRITGVTGIINANNMEQSHNLTQSSLVNNQSSSQNFTPGFPLGIMIKEIRSAFNLSQMSSRTSPRTNYHWPNRGRINSSH